MATLYAWQVRPVPSNRGEGYVWQWTREDLNGHTESVSDKCFDYYYDCIMDAKSHGYDPEVPRRLR